MAPGYGISNIGTYANDSAFWNAYYASNPNFRGAVQTQDSVPAQTITVPDTTSVDPTFKGADYGSAKSSGISGGTIATIGAIGVGAAATIMAFKRGKTNGFEGLKAIKEGFKSFLGKGGQKAAAETTESVAENISKLIKDGNGRLKTCEIKNGNDVVELAGDKVKQIVTKTEQKIKNVTGVRVPAGIDTKHKDVTLSQIERLVSHGGKDYKVILDTEGNVIETLLKNKKGVFVKAGDVKDYEKLVEKAQTYTAELKGVKLTLPDRHGVPTDITRNYNVSVRNGNVVDATYTIGGTTKHLTEEQFKLLQEARLSDIEKFGRVKGGYGIDPKNCIYEYTGANRRFLFRGDGRKTVTEAFDIKSTTINKPKQVSQYLEEHGMTDLTSTGRLPEGATIANATYRSESGNLYTIKNGKIESVKIKDKCEIKGKKGRTHTFRAGETITASGGRLNIWQNGLAINNSDYDAVLSLIK